jgi:hypothetical protein
MATADLSGLFGGNLTPEEQQMQMTEARAAQFAKLDPSQQLAFMGYKAGANLGQGLAQAAGVDIQDPAIKRATMLRQLAQGVDVTTVEGLQQYAARLQQAGFNAEANQLGQQILAARKTESEITRNERERRGLDPFEQLLHSGKYTPASLAKYKKSGDPADLELLEKPAKAQIKEVGVAEKTREPVYTYQATPDSEPRQVIYKTNAQGEQVMVPYSGGVDRTTSKTDLNVPLSLVDKESNLRKDYIGETKPISQVISTASRIEKLLNMGSLGEIIAQKQFSKLAGDNNISNKDVDNLSNFGDLGQRLAGTLSRFFEGSYSEAQRQEALKLVRELKASGTSQYNQIQQQYVDRARTEGIPEKTITFIAPNLPKDIRATAQLPAEGTKLRNKKTDEMMIVRGGKLVPFTE